METFCVMNRIFKASNRRFVLPASLFEPSRRLVSSPRYCVAAFLIMMSGAPVLASQSETARSAVERAIKVMGGDAVLTSVQTLQTHETHTAYRLTDSDHPEGPFLDSPTEATKYMELRHQRMVTQLDIRLPTGEEQVATVIYRGSESESRSTWNGKPSPTQLVAAPQNWDLGNPIIALQASLTAPDLKIAGTSRLDR